jgi:hypothetical protein
MITITPDNQIDRDGEVIGSIIGETAWMKAKQAPRIVGQIRQAAGINGLTFEVADAPTDKECLTVEPLSAVEVVDTLNGSEPVASCDDLAAGISFAIGSDWGTPGTQYFARCFINNHGNDAYSAYCKANGI